MSELLTFADVASHLPDEYRNLFIGFSGGIDSHVLLHLLASRKEVRENITAVYINHGLQQEAAQWEKHCQQICDQLGIAFHSIKVDATAKPKQSPEEAARLARYQAFERLLENAQDHVLLAQHREDQLETVLLQLFRGAGVQGLSGMPEQRPLGQGKVLRPLLNVSKKAIVQYAEAYQLQWIEDPSNQCDDFDRNFLRNQIIPAIKKRWPAADASVARTALHCASAQKILVQFADDCLQPALSDQEHRLNSAALSALTEEARGLVLRAWLERHQVPMPPTDRIQRVFDEVVMAAVDAIPQVQIQDFFIKRFDGHLYCINQQEMLIEPACIWPEETDEIMRANGYRLTRIPAASGIPKVVWQSSKISVKVRAGGEKIQLPGRTGHHALKKLFQAEKIPPWQRECMPLIYLDDRLAAVGGLWIDASFYREQGDCYLIQWKK